MATNADPLNKQPDGDIGNADTMKETNKYQKWIGAAEDKKRKYNKWAKAGAKAYSGEDFLESFSDDKSGALLANEQTKGKIFKYDVNFIRQPIERQITSTYARNPKFIAKPTQPMWADAEPLQQIDPMTGQVFMVPNIDPMTGLPVQQDISQQVCDVVEELMSVIFIEACFKAEAKACTREAHHAPASVMQVGYQFDEDAQKDEIYFRRRSFKNFIIDPKAEVYEGVVRRCRFMGLKWELTEAEATAIGLDWQALNSKENLSSTGNNADEMAIVYNIWDKESGVVAWVPENGTSLAKPLAPWPWKLSGFPYEILKLVEDSDQQFSKPPVLHAIPIQEELSAQREEITANTTSARPFSMYDTSMIDEATMTAISRRGKGANVPVEGLIGMPNLPIVRVDGQALSTEFYNHYDRNRSELIEVLGTSANESLRTTKSTAAEAQIVDKNAGSSTSGKIDIQTDFLNNTVKKAIQIMRQTYTTERVTQVTGRDNAKYWVKWIGSEILKNIEVDVETGSTEREDSAYNRQISLNMLETMKGIPGMDIVKLATEVLQEHGKRNPDEYVLGAQPMAPQPQVAGAGVGPTTGIDPAASIAGQMNAMV